MAIGIEFVLFIIVLFNTYVSIDGDEQIEPSGCALLLTALKLRRNLSATLLQFTSLKSFSHWDSQNHSLILSFSIIYIYNQITYVKST